MHSFVIHLCSEHNSKKLRNSRNKICTASDYSVFASLRAHTDVLMYAPNATEWKMDVETFCQNRLWLFDSNNMKHLNFKGHTRIKTTINVILLIKVKPAGNPGKVKKIRVMT